MKKLSSFCLALVLLYSYGFTFDYYQLGGPGSNVNMVPDVLGNVKIINSEGHTQIFNINSTDSFPVFTGFPKYNLTGQVTEGGILCNMDSDNDLELVYNAGYTIQAWNFDGTNVPGWPVTVSVNPLDGAPAAGDIDGDGEIEIVAVNHGVVPSNGGTILAFEKNGTAVTGFPVNHGYSSRTPVLANLDGAGGLEIIVNKRLTSSTSEIWVYRGTGAVFPGWPKLIDHFPASSSAVGDITGDGMPEVISESVNSLYAWGADGNPIAGFPFTLPGGDQNSYSSPVLVDVDGDNIREIVFGTHNFNIGDGAVYLLKNNGTVMSGWPKRTAQWIYGPPVVGLIDGDNIIDIAVGDQVASGVPADSIYAWNKDGTKLTGFPIGPINGVNNQISLADIDNDNNLELICDDNSTDGNGRGKYLAFNHNGTPVAGWEMNINGASFFSMPMIGDVNRDGILDIAGSGVKFSPITSNFYLWNTGSPFIPLKVINPMWQFNARHNGVYGDNPLVGIQPVSGVIPDGFSLGQNYPNPFNPSTRIQFEIPSGSAYATLKIFDMLGREVSTLVSDQVTAGVYEIEWSAKDQPSGVYFYKLTAGNFTQTKKMILLK